jgi:hypothetical protein
MQMNQAIPENYELIKNDDSLEILHRWYGAEAYFLVIVTTACFGFVGFFIKSAGGDNPGLGIFIVASPFILMGLFVAYINLAFFINKTRILANRTEISISHHPMPWRGNNRLAVSQLKQLYVKQVRSQIKNSHHVFYDLYARMKNRKEIKFISSLNDEQAKFIEREIENFLEIKNYRIKGEYKG